MVGSVLMERMQAEGDFDLIEPLFFSTSNAGGTAPAMAKNETKLKDAYDIDALKRCEIIITAQGGDYTSEVYPQAARGRLERPLDRRRFDAAHEGRRRHRARPGQHAGDQEGAGARAGATGSAAIAR